MNLAEDRERTCFAGIPRNQPRNQADAAGVVEALRGAGFAVDRVADLWKNKLDYRDALAVLVEWLPRTASPEVKQDIVRALSVRWARSAAPVLLAELERADGPRHAGLRAAIACALEVVAGDEIADGLIRAAADRRHGKARQRLVAALGKLTDPRVPDLLVSLVGDPEVAGQAAIALGTIHARGSRVRIEPLGRARQVRRARAR